MTSTINLCVLGLGGVGTSFLQILAHTPSLQQKFTLVALANSRSSIHLPHGISPSEPTSSSSPSKWVDAHPSAQPLDIRSLVHALSDSKKGTIVVDNSSSGELAGLYPDILRAGIHLCTPNKKAWSGDLKLWKNILKTAEEGYSLNYGESTVGAGLPILTTLKDLVETGDQVVKIEGILSGTLSYVFNQYSPAEPQKDKPTFSSILLTAKSLGYTEPDLRDDLSGVDVARKLTILSRQLPELAEKLENGYASVPTASLVPPALSSVKTAEEFLSRIEEGDAYFAHLRNEAESEGMVLRYVGVIDGKTGQIKCSLEKYSVIHPFATSLSGSETLVSFTTERFPAPSPLIVKGNGAGGPVTATGVWADCLRVWERRA